MLKWKLKPNIQAEERKKMIESIIKKEQLENYLPSEDVPA